MKRFCRPVVLTLSLLYTLALFVLMLEIFGVVAGAMSWANLLLIPIGLPWVLAESALPPSIGPWLVMIAPAVNLAILRLICGKGRG